MGHAVRKGLVLAALLCTMVVLTGCNNITGTWTGELSNASSTFTNNVSITFTDSTFRLVDSSLNAEASGTYTKSGSSITYSITRIVIDGQVSTGQATANGTFRLSGLISKTLRLDGGLISWFYESATTFTGKKGGGKALGEGDVDSAREVLDWTAVQPAEP